MIIIKTKYMSEKPETRYNWEYLSEHYDCNIDKQKNKNNKKNITYVNDNSNNDIKFENFNNINDTYFINNELGISKNKNNITNKKTRVKKKTKNKENDIVENKNVYRKNFNCIDILNINSLS